MLTMEAIFDDALNSTTQSIQLKASQILGPFLGQFFVVFLCVFHAFLAPNLIMNVWISYNIVMIRRICYSPQ